VCLQLQLVGPPVV